MWLPPREEYANVVIDTIEQYAPGFRLVNLNSGISSYNNHISTITIAITTQPHIRTIAITTQPHIRRPLLPSRTYLVLPHIMITIATFLSQLPGRA